MHLKGLLEMDRNTLAFDGMNAEIIVTLDTRLGLREFHENVMKSASGYANNHYSGIDDTVRLIIVDDFDAVESDYTHLCPLTDGDFNRLSSDNKLLELLSFSNSERKGVVYVHSNYSPLNKLKQFGFRPGSGTRPKAMWHGFRSMMVDFDAMCKRDDADELFSGIIGTFSMTDEQLKKALTPPDGYRITDHFDYWTGKGGLVEDPQNPTKETVTGCDNVTPTGNYSRSEQTGNVDTATIIDGRRHFLRKVGE